MQRAGNPFFFSVTPILPYESRRYPTPPVVLRLLEMKGGDVSSNSIRLLLDLYERWIADGKPERGKRDTKK